MSGENMLKTALFFSILALWTPAFASRVQAETFKVGMTDREFKPDFLRIKAGDTVEWTNSDEDMHLVVSGTNIMEAKNKPKPLDSGMLMPRQKYSYTFTKPGSYKYICVTHFMQNARESGVASLQEMKGIVIVEPAAGDQSAATPVAADKKDN